MRYTNQISVSIVKTIPEAVFYQGIKVKNTGLKVAVIDKMPVCYYGDDIIKDDGEYDFYMAPMTIPRGFSFRLYDGASNSIIEDSAPPMERNFQLQYIFDIKKTSQAIAEGNRVVNSSQPAHDDCEAEHFMMQKIMQPVGTGTTHQGNGPIAMGMGVGKGCVGSLALNRNFSEFVVISGGVSPISSSKLVFFYEFTYPESAANSVKGKTYYFIPILFPNFAIGFLRIPKNNSSLKELQKVAEVNTMNESIKAFDLEVNENVKFEEILVGTMYVTKAIKAIFSNRTDIVLGTDVRV